MKKTEIHLAIPLSLITTSCQGASCPALPRALLPEIFNLCKTNLTRFDNLAATFDLCRT